MNWITRLRIARAKVKLAKLLAMDGIARRGKTTIRMMDDVVDRGHDIAVLRHEVAKLEGTLPDVDDSGGFDDRLPSQAFCPTAKPSKE